MGLVFQSWVAKSPKTPKTNEVFLAKKNQPKADCFFRVPHFFPGLAVDAMKYRILKSWRPQPVVVCCLNIRRWFLAMVTSPKCGERKFHLNSEPRFDVKICLSATCNAATDISNVSNLFKSTLQVDYRTFTSKDSSKFWPGILANGFTGINMPQPPPNHPNKPRHAWKKWPHDPTCVQRISKQSIKAKLPTCIVLVKYSGKGITLNLVVKNNVVKHVDLDLQLFLRDFENPTQIMSVSNLYWKV